MVFAATSSCALFRAAAVSYAFNKEEYQISAADFPRAGSYPRERQLTVSVLTLYLQARVPVSVQHVLRCYPAATLHSLLW